MKTKWWAIVLIFVCTLTLAVAQIFWKLGAESPTPFNYYIFFGFLTYGLSGVFLIFALKGGELSVIHPFISLSLVWVAILSPIFFLQDSMTLTKWIGLTLIISGVLLIGYGGVFKK